MKPIRAAFQRHIEYISKYSFTCLLLLVACFVVVYTSIESKTLLHAIGYIVVCWLCAFVTDIIVIAAPKESIRFPIKKPLRKELLTIIICTLLGVTFLIIRFFTDWQHVAGMVKLAVLPLVLFTFPVVLAVIYLFVYKYKFKELGVNLNYWYLPIVLHIVWGAFTYWLAPDKMHWREALQEYSILNFLFTGIVTAALSEEFSRLLLTTRIAKALNSPAMGLFIASAIWGAMHIPVGYGHSHEPVTLWSAVQNISYLVPLGMFWGYLTMRTKSLLPAVMMHGFNLWGLQNF